MRGLVLVLSLLAALPTLAHADGVAATLPSPAEVGVRVEKPAGDGVHYSQGSGVYLGGGLVLTTAHVVKFDPDHSHVIVLLDGVRTDGNLVFDGQKHSVDLALIKLETSELSPRRREQTPVPVCLDNPGPNQPVVVAALGTVSNAATISSPISADGKETGTWTNILSTGYHAGNSGGGVFHPRQGCLWGIIDFEMGGPLKGSGVVVDLTAFIPATKIAPFIGDYFEEAIK